jgi:hypothetical protein
MEAAKLSASNMELMTENMHVIAKKTEVETISMRIITVVTLFFLPGTFISVWFILLFNETVTDHIDSNEHSNGPVSIY